MNVRLVTNTKKNHLSELISLISAADEIWMATAFLKQSGLNKLLPLIKKHLLAAKPIHVIAGQNFGLTEPAALLSLHDLFCGSTNSRAYLANAIKPKEVFHPKLYVFRQNETYTIISGSANLTEGGLQSNTECSLLIESAKNDDICKETLLFFDQLMAPGYSQELSLLVIKQYETYFEEQKQLNRKSKAIPAVKKSQLNFNYPTLLAYLNEFNKAEREKIFKEKMESYKDAKRVLNHIADDAGLTKEKFIEYIDVLVGRAGKSKLWHSGSLHRKRDKTYPHYKTFQKLVQYIKAHSNDSPGSLFLKGKEFIEQIEGAGINYLTEIMMTYNPDRYANMNNNPLTVLRSKAGLKLKASTASYNAEDYEEYCQLVKEISEKLGLRNMLEADSFFNEIYWQIKYK